MTEAYFAHAYGPDYEKRNPPYKWRSFLGEILRLRKGGRLLEAGCGYGLFLRQAAAFFDCVGCDTSEFAVRQARARLPANVPLFRAALPALETRGRFDVVAAFDVLEHVPDLDAALENLDRLLVPGGLLAFTVPVYDGPLGPLVDRLDKDQTHVHRRGRDFWLERLPPRFRLRRYTGIWRHYAAGVYLNRVSRLSRRITTAILVLAEKPAEGGA